MASNIKAKFNKNHKFYDNLSIEQTTQEFQSLPNHLFQIPHPIAGPPS